MDRFLKQEDVRRTVMAAQKRYFPLPDYMIEFLDHVFKPGYEPAPEHIVAWNQKCGDDHRIAQLNEELWVIAGGPELLNTFERETGFLIIAAPFCDMQHEDMKAICARFQCVIVYSDRSWTPEEPNHPRWDETVPGFFHATTSRARPGLSGKKLCYVSCVCTKGCDKMRGCRIFGTTDNHLDKSRQAKKKQNKQNEKKKKKKGKEKLFEAKPPK